MNWEFVRVHVYVALGLALASGLFTFAADLIGLAAWLFLSTSHAAFWCIREMWDQDFTFKGAFDTTQHVAEWLAPAVAFPLALTLFMMVLS